MKDRVTEYPHRYRDAFTGQLFNLIPEPGRIAEEGTPICKGTLLSDRTEKMLGMEDTTLDMALQQVIVLLLSGFLRGGDEKEMESGSFTDGASGWGTHTFKHPFTSKPVVVAQAQPENLLIDIRGVTREKFLYWVKNYSNNQSASHWTVNYIAIGGAD